MKRQILKMRAFLLLYPTFKQLQQTYVQFCLDLQINVLTIYNSYCSFVRPSDCIEHRLYLCCYSCDFVRRGI